MRELVLGFTVLSLIAAGEAQPVAAQNGALDQQPTVSRMPWGDPDLEGLWDYATSTPLQRPQKYAGRERLTEEEAADENLAWSTFATSERRSELSPRFDLSLNFNQFWWNLGTSIGRTSLITDPAHGRLPPRTSNRQDYEATPEAKWLQTVGWGLAPADGPEHYGLNARCIVERRVPITPSSDNNHVQILQTPGYVVILQEKIHDFRIIPVTNQPDVAHQVRQWLGVSRGRWEEDTLVVETRNLRAQENYSSWGMDRRIVERFTRRGEGAVDYSFTVTDLSVWTRPWGALVPWRAADGPIFEYACHEGNYSMPLMLKGARAVDARP